MDGVVTHSPNRPEPAPGPWPGPPPPPWRARRKTSLSDIQERAARWLSTPALTDLFAAFGEPEITGIEHDADALATWATTHLDTRNGQERHEAPAFAFSHAQIDALLHAAIALGLVSTAVPTRDRYHATVLLGGTALGNQLRTEYARHLESTGTRLGQVVALATNRPLTPSEQELTRAFSHTTEWEHLAATVDELLGPIRPATGLTHEPDHADEWIDIHMQRHAGEVRLMSAPSSTSERRATTADAIAFLTRRIPATHRQDLLIITSSIYTPYQYFLVAPTLLRQGSELVEFVGTPTAPGTDLPKQAQRIAQEINSTLQAIRSTLSRDSRRRM
jgi:hypothetical protein